MNKIFKRILIGLATLIFYYFSSWLLCYHHIPLPYSFRYSQINMACSNLEYPTYFVPVFIALAVAVAWPDQNKQK